MQKHKHRQWGGVPVLSAILVIVSALCGSTAGAAGGKEVEAAEKRDITSEFIIGAFPGPPDGYIDEGRYREMAGAGVDVIVPFWGTMDGASNRDMLDLAHAAGLRVLAMDTRIGPPALSASAEFDPAVVESIVRDYGGHPALFAYGVRDEPSAELFDRVAEISRVFRRLDPDHPPLGNLFPGYATLEQLGTESYREYVMKYIEQVEPAVLMYDHYPYKARRESDTGWYRDLALFREVSRETGIPFWLFVQCEGISGSLRVPTREEIFRQAATALAYGARGIWWYRYWTQPVDGEGASKRWGRHVGSMIDQQGNRSPSYDYVRLTNLFLRKVGPALLGWDNTNVAQMVDGRYAVEDCPCVSLGGEDSDLVVGTFRRGGRVRLVLANDDCERQAVFRITARGGLRIKRAIASWSAGVPIDVNAKAEKWSLGPAGCVVVELGR